MIEGMFTKYTEGECTSHSVGVSGLKLGMISDIETSVKKKAYRSSQRLVVSSLALDGVHDTIGSFRLDLEFIYSLLITKLAIGFGIHKGGNVVRVFAVVCLMPSAPASTFASALGKNVDMVKVGQKIFESLRVACQEVSGGALDDEISQMAMPDFRGF